MAKSITTKGTGRPDFLTELPASTFDITEVWDRRHVAVGSTYVGSWYSVAGKSVKTLQALSTMGGSLHTVIGMSGSAADGFTGTYDSQRLQVGSLTLVSTRESFRYLRPIVLVGSVGSGKGTLSVSVARQR